MKFTKQTDKKEYVVPSGNHAGRIISVIDLGTQIDIFEGKEKQKHKIMITCELSNEKADFGDGVEKPYVISKTFTLSSHPKSTLILFLQGALGRDFTDDELDVFDFQALNGTALLINVGHREGENSTYSNIIGFAPIPKGMTVQEQINQSKYFSLDDFDETVYNSLNDYQKGLIAKSPEYQKIINPPKPEIKSPGKQEALF